MTCIVGIETPDGVVIGADSLSLWGGCVQLLSEDTPKIVVVEDRMVWAVAGALRLADAIRYGLDAPPNDLALSDPDKYVRFDLMAALREALAKHAPKDGSVNANWGIILGIHGRLYEIDEAFSASRTRSGYSAVGSGGRVALGSLYSTTHMDSPTERVRTALAAAAEHDDGVRPPFVIRTLRKT